MDSYSHCKVGGVGFFDVLKLAISPFSLTEIYLPVFQGFFVFFA